MQERGHGKNHSYWSRDLEIGRCSPIGPLLARRLLMSTNTRTLIIAKRTGQMGNRLQVYAHILAAAMEHGWRVINPSFGEYARLFEGTRENPLGIFPPDHVRKPTVFVSARMTYLITRLLYQSGKVLQGAGLPAVRVARARSAHFVSLPALLEKIEEYPWKLLITQGLHFYADQWCATHADAIRQFLMPVEPFRSEGARTVESLRTQHGHIIGLHMRCGDYSSFRNGRYYYSPTFYRAAAERALALQAHCHPALVVCSDQSVDPSLFSGLPVVCGGGSALTDLHTLSCCDSLLGPPSSFSGWAAFYGGKPLLFLEKPHLDFGFDSFTVPRSPRGVSNEIHKVR